MKQSMLNLLFLGFTIVIALASCNSSNQSENQQISDKLDDEVTLGEISIDVTCSQDALPLFNEGLLLLHSFQFDDAAEKFQEAQEMDSTCAMAFWGEAMSENHPLWREQDKTKALEILDRLGSDKTDQRAKFTTDFEKDMFDAITILYGEGTKKENDQAYAAYMEKLSKKYPDHHEVSAFYALSMLGAIEDDRKDDLYEKGAKIAQSIIDENPNHPGALHYLIHSYDDPKNAPKALDAANRYSKVAPDAAHALHMPSHIYIALGKWDEVISSNKAAVAASIERKEKKDLGTKAIDFHSLKWLMYAHLQKGEFEAARNLVQQMEDYCEEESSPRAVTHNVMMKAAYFTETKNWDDALVNDTIDYSELSVQIFGTRCYVRGIQAFHNNNKDSIEQIIAEMDVQISDANKEVMSESATMCSGNYDRRRPTKNHIKRTKVVRLQLQALMAMLDKNDSKAEEFMQQAIEEEESTTYLYGPPEIVKPSHEMYAEWLEEKGRNDEALVYYNKVLERAPGKLIPLRSIERLSETE